MQCLFWFCYCSQEIRAMHHGNFSRETIQFKNKQLHYGPVCVIIINRIVLQHFNHLLFTISEWFHLTMWVYVMKCRFLVIFFIQMLRYVIFLLYFRAIFNDFQSELFGFVQCSSINCKQKLCPARVDFIYFEYYFNLALYSPLLLVLIFVYKKK